MMVKTEETESQALPNTKLESKLQLALEGLNPSIRRSLLGISKRNLAYIIDYIINEMKIGNNASVNYVRMNIYAIVDLVKHCKKSDMRKITRGDVISYLDSLKKTEAQDPMHKWIGTHSLHRVILSKFFKWVYYSGIEPKKRPKPNVVENIPKYKRRFQFTNLLTYGVVAITSEGSNENFMPIHYLHNIFHLEERFLSNSFITSSKYCLASSSER